MGANRCLLLAESSRWFVALVLLISMVRHWILIIFLDFRGFQMFPAWLSLRIDWRVTRRGPAPTCLMGSLRLALRWMMPAGAGAVEGTRHPHSQIDGLLLSQEEFMGIMVAGACLDGYRA